MHPRQHRSSGPVHEGSGGRHGRRAARLAPGTRPGAGRRRAASSAVHRRRPRRPGRPRRRPAEPGPRRRRRSATAGVASRAAPPTAAARRARPTSGARLVGTGLAARREAVTAPPAQDPPAGALARRRPLPGDRRRGDRGRRAVRVVRHRTPVSRPTSRGPGSCPTRAPGSPGSRSPRCPGSGPSRTSRPRRPARGTFLDDNGAGGSDVVSRATTTVGDISLLGGAVTVDVTSPVVLQARSDGTDGSAGYVEPADRRRDGRRAADHAPGRRAAAADHAAARPRQLGEPDPDGVPRPGPVQRPHGQGDRRRLLRVDLEVLDVGVLDAADVSLAIAPMSVEATAPAGGVECGAGDVYAPAPPGHRVAGRRRPRRRRDAGRLRHRRARLDGRRARLDRR